MRTRLTVLAVAALLTLGTGSVVAASMDDPTADDESAEVLPANHSVDVLEPDEIDADDVDRALEAAWENETVRAAVEDDSAVHFEVWGSAFDDEEVVVDVAPGATPGETRIVAEVDLDEDRVTSVDEPVTLNVTQSTSVDLDGEDVHEVENGEEIVFVENVTRDSAASTFEVQVEEHSTDGGDETATADDDDGAAVFDFGVSGTAPSPAPLPALLG